MIRFAGAYFFWHYTKALKKLIGNCRTFLLFILHFFSIGILFKTLFKPWQRLGEEYKKGFDIGAFLSSFFINFLMRIIGFLIRLVVIIIGLFFFFSSFIGCIALFIIWLVLPLLIPVFFISGLRLLLL